MVRLIDVATRCGVSVATVSKALNDKGDIGEDTKERIRRVCEEMGYFPNSSARTLKLGRSYDLGVVFIAEDESGLTHDYFSSILEAFRVQAQKQGYDITFIGSSEKEPQMSCLERAKYRGVDGVLIACADYENKEVFELIHSDLPVVTIDHSFTNRTSVVSNNTQGMRELVEFICDRGHRRVAYIYGNITWVTRSRIDAFYKTMKAYGVDAPDPYVRSAVYRYPKPSYQITQELLDLHDRPTCIIYPDDYACIGGLNAIRERGFRIPEDISVAGYDGIYLSQILKPKLATVRQNTREIGKSAAKELIGLIEAPQRCEPKQIVVDSKLLEGGSVGIVQESGQIRP